MPIIFITNHAPMDPLSSSPASFSFVNCVLTFKSILRIIYYIWVDLSRRASGGRGAGGGLRHAGIHISPSGKHRVGLPQPFLSLVRALACHLCVEAHLPIKCSHVATVVTHKSSHVAVISTAHSECSVLDEKRSLMSGQRWQQGTA